MNSLNSSRSSSRSSGAGKDHSYRRLLTGCGLLRRKRRNRINPGGFAPPSTSPPPAEPASTDLDNVAVLTTDSSTLEVVQHKKPDELVLEAVYDKEPEEEVVAQVVVEEEDDGEDALEKWRAQLAAWPLSLSTIKEEEEEEEEERDGVLISYEEEEEEFYTPPSSPRWYEE